MNYQFESKVAVEQIAKRSILQVLCLIGAVVLVVLNLILAVIDGIGEIDIITGVALPIFMFSSGLTRRKKVDYVPTLVRIDLEEGKAVVTYPELRRFTDRPAVREKYEYISKYIRIFEYSSELKAVRLYGFPVITIGNKVDDTYEDDREIVVYLPEEQAEEICTEMEKYLHKPAKRVDE